MTDRIEFWLRTPGSDYAELLAERDFDPASDPPEDFEGRPVHSFTQHKNEDGSSAWRVYVDGA